MTQMNLSMSVLALMTINYAMIGILPKIFFRTDGSFNLRWWLTAGPFLVAPISLYLMQAGLVSLDPGLVDSTMWREIVAVALSVLSMCLMTFTLGTHRIPLALWHQENDAPKQIVTWGAYKKIRHPFYSSFILAQVAALIFAPHILTILALLYAYLILNATAAREEIRLSSSEYGSEYQKYMENTGRFFPKLLQS